ncbi:MAG: hypothetical protein HY204_04410 [Nitrospirae bacterium]|nr:hypothetical protein [Nitrospirota bacterium]
MSTIIAVFDVPGMTSGQYDQAVKDLKAAGAGSPKGRLYHVASSKAAAGLWWTFGKPLSCSTSLLKRSCLFFKRMG